MAETCKTNCPIWLLSKGHVACSPLVRQTVERKVLRAIDASDESRATEIGSFSAGIIDEVDHRVERLDQRLEEVARECDGPILMGQRRGRLVMICTGMDENALEGILDTQVDMIRRFEADS